METKRVREKTKKKKKRPLIVVGRYVVSRSGAEALVQLKLAKRRRAEGVSGRIPVIFNMCTHTHGRARKYDGRSCLVEVVDIPSPDSGNPLIGCRPT